MRDGVYREIVSNYILIPPFKVLFLAATYVALFNSPSNFVVVIVTVDPGGS
jgi:hypothetical protein